MVNFLEKIRNIILGWLFKLFEVAPELARKRLDVCNNCEYRKNSPLGDVCGECGCVLDAKTRLIDEHCDLDKW